MPIDAHPLENEVMEFSIIEILEIATIALFGISFFCLIVIPRKRTDLNPSNVRYAKLISVGSIFFGFGSLMLLIHFLFGITG